MTITFKASASAAGTTATAVTVNVPTGTAAGDLMIAALITDSAVTVTATTPTGWTLLSGSPGGGSNNIYYYYYRFASSSEPANYSFAVQRSGTQFTGIIASYTGVSPAIDVIGTVAKANTGSPASPLTVTGVTTTRAGVLVLLATQETLGTNSLGTPTGFTSRIDANPYANGEAKISDIINNTVGASGNVSLTWGGIGYVNAVLIQVVEAPSVVANTSKSLFSGTNL